MQCFAKNRCHLCSKVFCCSDCREAHQRQFHKIEPDCEICLYGRGTIKNVSIILFNHIKKFHWPLHCVFCKKQFETLDELIPHGKCDMNPNGDVQKNMPKTPVTPVVEQEASLVVTPFYKICVPGTLQPGVTATIGATSTPLQQNADKITPVNNNQKKFYKSNLKLTASTGRSDSKKMERRVTFGETPSFSSDPYEKENKDEKAISLQSTTNESKTSHDSYVNSSKGNIYKTPPTHPEKYDNRSIDNKIIIFDKTSDTTFWESALTHLEYRSSVEINESHPKHYNNMEVQINIYSKDVQPENEKGPQSTNSPKNLSLWASVSSIMKSVVNNISATAQTNLPNKTCKRPYPYNDSVTPNYKKMKLTELRCRPSIRNFSSLDLNTSARIRTADKATQTDETFYIIKK